MTKKNKLGLVIATKEEALWIKVRDAAIERLQLAENNTIIEKEIVKFAKHKILLEKRK